jgi:hypothetical protein
MHVSSISIKTLLKINVFKNAKDHITLNVPVLVRSPKFSNVEPGMSDRLGIPGVLGLLLFFFCSF